MASLLDGEAVAVLVMMMLLREEEAADSREGRVVGVTILVPAGEVALRDDYRALC